VNVSWRALALSIAFALSIETLHAQRPTDLVNTRFVAEVTHVIDGDTVDVLIPPARRVRIRLHGVDTPERKEPFSERARSSERGFWAKGASKPACVAREARCANASP
jgi:endonuclease YncB( thermonuclease family)